MANACARRPRRFAAARLQPPSAGAAVVLVSVHVRHSDEKAEKFAAAAQVSTKRAHLPHNTPPRSSSPLSTTKVKQPQNDSRPVPLQAVNAANIEAAEAAIVGATAGELAGDGVVLAVGDWNGPLGAGGVPPEALGAGGPWRVRAGPAVPTQYGKPLAIDGAAAYATSAAAVRVECAAIDDRGGGGGGPS